MLEILATFLLIYIVGKVVNKIFPSDGTLFDRWYH